MKKLILSIASILLIGAVAYARFTTLSGSGGGSSGSATWPVSGTPSVFTPDGTSSTTWSGSNTFNNTVNFSSGLFASSLDNVVMRAYGLSGSGYGYWDISSPNSSGGAAIRMYTSGGLKSEFGYSGNSSPAARWGSFWLTNYPGGGSTITVSAINGFVGINQGAPRTQLDVTGGITATSSGTFASLSVQGGGSSVLDTGTQSVRTDLINGTTYTYTASSTDVTNVDWHMYSTDSYLLNGMVLQTRYSSATYALSFSTLSWFGKVMFDASLSTRSQEFVAQVDMASADSTVDPILRYAATRSTGPNPNQINFSMAIASAGAGTADIDQLIWNSSYTVVTTTSAAISTNRHEQTSSMALTNWKNIIGSGFKTVYIKFIGVADPAGAQRFIETVFMDIRKKT